MTMILQDRTVLESGGGGGATTNLGRSPQDELVTSQQTLGGSTERPGMRR